VIDRAGRRVHQWAGKDIVIKAGAGDVDISSAKGNTRIKAENNMMVLGGNNGTGGTLIESRGRGDMDFSQVGLAARAGGLLLRSAGDIASWAAKRQYHRSENSFTLDAKGGDSAVQIYSDTATVFTTRGFKVLVSPSKETTSEKATSLFQVTAGEMGYYGSAIHLGAGSFKMFNHRSSGAGASTSVSIKGSLQLDGSGTASSGFNKADVDKSAFVNQGYSEAVQEVQKDYKKANAEDHTASTGLGNEANFTLVGFSFRKTEELALGDMVIHESSWQKRFRHAKSTNVWDESTVSGHVTAEGSPAAGFDTMPFPGIDAWEQANKGAELVTSDDQFYEWTDTGAAPKARGLKGVNYDKVEPPEPVRGAFKGRYLINL
jgi:hypothetical protein